MSENKYFSVDASPVKRFFVEMLTRDIEIEDAILDLLDNCVDGILRSHSNEMDSETPYDGFWAKITANTNIFEIEDNCGGIPWSEHDRAFRMGRPVPSNQSTTDGLTGGVGAYGIGMKRAIFKMGGEALIWTQNGEDNYEVPISTDWMNTEEDWSLEVKTERGRMGRDGTYIIVQNLNKDVSERFSAESFKDDLLDKIANHYAVIIRKGFIVEVNGTRADPKPIVFRFSERSGDDEIRPYIFKSTYNDVQVFVAVGLRESIPDAEKILEEHEGVRFSSDYAGWTIICNDRVVLYCDRTELTGWGILGIPRYHTQFIAISGVVEFRGDPKKLPTTTTKRGLNFSSSLYQQVLTRMQEGLRLFVNFTNKWKSLEEEVKIWVSPVPSLTYSQLRVEAEKLPFHETRSGLEGEQFKPKLPMPPNNSPDVRISYTREKSIVLRLAEELLPDFEDIREKDIPRSVGIASFDFACKSFLKSDD